MVEDLKLHKKILQVVQVTNLENVSDTNYRVVNVCITIPFTSRNVLPNVHPAKLDALQT